MIVEESVWAQRRLVLGGLGIIGGLYVVVFVLPMIFMVAVSLGGARLGISQDLVHPWDAYERFWGDSYYREVVWRTMQLAVATVVCTIAIGLPLAYLAVRGSGIFRILTLVAVLNPLVVSVIIRTYGLRQLLDRIGIEAGFWSVLIGCVQVLLPFMVIPLMNGFREVDPLTVHSARTLGAKAPRIALRIVLPTLLPSILAGSVLVFILCFNVFSIPLLLGESTKPTLGLQVYESSIHGSDFTFASAIAMTMLAMAMLVMTAQGRLARSAGRAGVL